jgi:hydrogenase maturation protease
MVTSQPHTLVIGVGNAYRSDDAVGLIVAQRLKQQSVEGLAVLEESGSGAALIDLWGEADSVILIDAVQSGREPGTIHCLDARAESFSSGIFRFSTHAFGIAEAVELARVLNQLPKRCIVYGIEGSSFAAGVGLSPEVEQAAEQVVLRVLHDLQDDPRTPDIST